MGPVSIAAVGWLMGSLINKAVTELLEAWAKRLDLGDEFKTLKKQLQQLSALLTSARRLGADNSFLEDLVLDLQQLAYKAENLLDELDYYRLEDEIQQRGTQEKENYNNKSLGASSSSGDLLASHPIISTFEGLFIHSAPYAPVPLPETSPSIINLSRRMNELAKQLQESMQEVRKAVKTESLVRTAQNTEICQTKATNLRQTSSFLTEPSVFGRDQERDQLMIVLTKEEPAIVGRVPVVAIVGTGGVGKTTLARLVFNDPKVHSYFEFRSWISVSTQFDINRLTHEMLEGVCGKKCDLTNLNELQNKLKTELEAKRFLLVLDDMWEDKDRSQWDSLVAPLNYCKVKGSIILVTTRNKSVAKMVDARVVSLHGLDEDAFLLFFSTCIFNDSNYGGNSILRNIGQEIASKLKGNPLAAKTVSALLKETLDERYWMKIKDSEEWKSQSDPNDIMPALRLSYEHMPFHLQRCFSYCAIFPEDHPFTCNELVYLWMAEGFLDMRSEGKRIEDIGSAYFVDLFNRGFFQTKQSTTSGLVYYTFHDLIHDLACMVASKECLSINGPVPRQIPTTIRHLSIFNRTERHEEAIVRALVCLEGENVTTIINWDKLSSGTSGSISNLLKKTKYLRSMRLKRGTLVQHHCFIQNFLSLRYLSLDFGISNVSNNTTAYTLPDEICRLYHLQVFEIKSAMNLNELPNNFSDLISLRYFISDHEGLHSKIRGVGKLTSLQELNHFHVQQKNGFEIEQLGSLKEIGGSLIIWSLQNVKSKIEASKARLAEKEKLDALYLRWTWKSGEQGNESVLEGLKPTTNLKFLEILGYGGVASPTWLDSSLIFLESLTLTGCKAWEVLPPIGDLEFLKHLKLSKLAVKEIGPQCYGTRRSIKFPSLEKLEITDMLDLEKWVWTDQLQQFHCFKKLQKLEMNCCPKLVDLPVSGWVSERFPSLTELKITNCPLIFNLPPLPYSSLLSRISISSGVITSLLYMKDTQYFRLLMNPEYCCRLKVEELLALYEISSVHSLEIFNISSFEYFLDFSFLRFLNIYGISSLEYLDLHSFLALEKLVISGCQSLTSLTFGEHLIHLWSLKIESCNTLSSINGLKSWVNLKELLFQECPGFIAAWESASKDIERTEPDFSLSLTKIEGDSLALLTLPICKQLISLQIFELEFSSFNEEHEVSLQLLNSLDLVDIRGCKNLHSFPFDLFPSLKRLGIKFPSINKLTINNSTEIKEDCKKLRNIKQVYISERDPVYNEPAEITLYLS